MQEHTTKAAPVPEITVGVDVGDRYSHLCLLDATGEVVEDGRVQTTREALLRRFGNVARMRVVLETGTHSPWISRVLAACGHEVLVANARRLRLIAASDSKSDRTDAEMLARLGRADPTLLSPVRHRGEAVQTDLALLRARGAGPGAHSVSQARAGRGEVARRTAAELLDA